MGKALDRMKLAWSVLGNLWLAKDIWLYVGLPAFGGATISALFARIFVSLSTFDTVIVALVAALIFATIGMWFASRSLPAYRDIRKRPEPERDLKPVVAELSRPVVLKLSNGASVGKMTIVDSEFRGMDIVNNDGDGTVGEINLERSKFTDHKPNSL